MVKPITKAAAKASTRLRSARCPPSFPTPIPAIAAKYTTTSWSRHGVSTADSKPAESDITSARFHMPPRRRAWRVDDRQGPGDLSRRRTTMIPGRFELELESFGRPGQDDLAGRVDQREADDRRPVMPHIGRAIHVRDLDTSSINQ